MTTTKPKRARGEGGIFRRPGSRFWYVQHYSWDGTPIRESTGTDNRQKALGILRDRLSRRDAGEPVIPTKVRFEQAAADLRTHYATTKKRDLKEVEKRLAPRPPSTAVT